MNRSRGTDTPGRTEPVASFPNSPGERADLRESPRVSVIVPVRHGGEHFVRSLESIQRALRREDEVIVVADGGAADDIVICDRLGVRVLRYRAVRGPAYARNRGAEAAAGDILFFVDADVLVPEGILDEIVHVFTADSATAALIGSYDDEPGDKGFVSRYRNLLHHYTHQRANAEAATFWGACGAIRRNAFFDVQGFDESFEKPSVEDIDLGYRLIESGNRIRLEKHIQVKHLKAWSPLSMIETDIFRRAVPWAELLLRYRSVRLDLNLRVENHLSGASMYILIVALAVSPWFAGAFVVAATCALVLLALNAPFYRFLAKKNGIAFATLAVPWHWLFYLYGGIGAALGVLRYLRTTADVEPGLVGQAVGQR